MTPEQIDLARRLVARPEWTWDDINVPALDVDDSEIPDLTDDATGGVLLGLLWGWCEAHTSGDTRHEVQVWSGWEIAVVRVVDHGRYTEEFTPVCEDGPTLAEAAARALLACWEAADGRSA